MKDVLEPIDAGTFYIADPDAKAYLISLDTHGSLVGFELKDAKPMDGGVVWLRYTPKNVTSD